MTDNNNFHWWLEYVYEALSDEVFYEAKDWYKNTFAVALRLANYYEQHPVFVAGVIASFTANTHWDITISYTDSYLADITNKPVYYGTAIKYQQNQADKLTKWHSDTKRKIEETSGSFLSSKELGDTLIDTWVDYYKTLKITNFFYSVLASSRRSQNYQQVCLLQPVCCDSWIARAWQQIPYSTIIRTPQIQFFNSKKQQLKCMLDLRQVAIEKNFPTWELQAIIWVAIRSKVIGLTSDFNNYLP
jgi:hypothetical protein